MSNDLVVKKFEMTNTDIQHMAQLNTKVEAFNRHIIKTRKKILHESLMEATKIRTDIMKKIKNWLDVIENRLFDPSVIAELDINKVMSLLKIVTTYSVKMLGQVNQMEGLLKTYMDAERMTTEFQQNRTPSDQQTNEYKAKLTKMIYEQLVKVNDAIIVNPVEETKPEIITNEETKPDLGDDLDSVLKPI